MGRGRRFCLLRIPSRECPATGPWRLRDVGRALCVLVHSHTFGIARFAAPHISSPRSISPPPWIRPPDSAAVGPSISSCSPARRKKVRGLQSRNQKLRAAKKKEMVRGETEGGEREKGMGEELALQRGNIARFASLTLSPRLRPPVFSPLQAFAVAARKETKARRKGSKRDQRKAAKDLY